MKSTGQLDTKDLLGRFDPAVRAELLELFRTTQLNPDSPTLAFLRVILLADGEVCRRLESVSQASETAMGLEKALESLTAVMREREESLAELPSKLLAEASKTEGNYAKSVEDFCDTITKTVEANAKESRKTMQAIETKSLGAFKDISQHLVVELVSRINPVRKSLDDLWQNETRIKDIINRAEKVSGAVGEAVADTKQMLRQAENLGTNVAIKVGIVIGIGAVLQLGAVFWLIKMGVAR